MNLTDFLLMKNGNTVKPDADLFDILLAKKLGGAGVITTLTGNPLSFLSKKAQYAKSTLVTLSPVQSGSGDPSPDNIRPITGRSAVTIEGCGVNSFDRSTATIYNRYINVATEKWQTSTEGKSFAFACKPNTTYTISCHNSNITIFRVGRINYEPPFEGYISVYGLQTMSSDGSITITTFSPTKYIVVQINGSIINAGTEKLQIEEGSTAHDYEPYTESNDVTISFGETVYGGTLNVETGECVVDKIMYHLYALSWTYSSTTGSFTNKKGSKNIKMNSTPICSCFIGMPSVNANAAVTSMGDNRIVFKRSTDDQRIYAKYSAANGDVDVFISAVNGQYICCQMETPLTLTLTPEQVSILKGQNTIWIEDDGAVMELSYMN